MRKRKRDWPIIVYKYRAYPASIPQSVWDTAKLQRELWNRLVALADRYSEWARLLGDKKAAWVGFDEAAQALVKESGLDWVNGPQVLDRLRVTFRNRRFPRSHGALDRVSLSHRFTGGGIALVNIIDSTRAKRFALQSSPSWQLPRRAHSPGQRHWRGRFQIGTETIDFALALNRALPEGSILKRVQWLGKRAGSKWFWYLALTLETPPVEKLANQSQLTAGLDLGWRAFVDGTPNDYLRVGMLVDSEGRMIELRLPLALRDGPQGERRSLGYFAELQSLADDCLNCGRELAGDRRLGVRGLRQLVADGHEHADGISAALSAYDLLRKRLSEQRFHALQRRRWWYQNLAQWLCRRYAVIALEADMKLPALHAKSDDPALRAAAAYRNYAAVGELRKYLTLAAVKWGTRIEGETANTTSICWQCGGKIEVGAVLELICDNGHRRDQDGNAARNLFSQLTGDFGQTHELRNVVGGRGWKRLVVPETLRAVAVEVPAG